LNFVIITKGKNDVVYTDSGAHLLGIDVGCRRVASFFDSSKIWIERTSKICDWQGWALQKPIRRAQRKCCMPLYSYTLDRNGTLLSEESTGSPIDPGSLSPNKPQKPIYNAKGQLVGEETYEQNGSLISKTLFSFDANGTKIEENTYSAKGRLSKKRIFGSDGRHLLVEEITLNFDGSPYGRWTYDEYVNYDNCTKSTAWEWRMRDGKGSWEPDATYYKVITYY
jgi:hypothetical protein